MLLKVLVQLFQDMSKKRKEKKKTVSYEFVERDHNIFDAVLFGG